MQLLCTIWTCICKFWFHSESAPKNDNTELSVATASNKLCVPKVIQDFGIGTQQIRRQYKHSTLADSINRYVPHAIFFSDEALLPLAVQHSHRRGVSLTHFTGEIILRNRSNTTVLVPCCSGKVERSNRAKALSYKIIRIHQSRDGDLYSLQ